MNSKLKFKESYPWLKRYPQFSSLVIQKVSARTKCTEYIIFYDIKLNIFFRFFFSMSGGVNLGSRPALDLSWPGPSREVKRRSRDLNLKIAITRLGELIWEIVPGIFRVIHRDASIETNLLKLFFWRPPKKKPRWTGDISLKITGHH